MEQLWALEYTWPQAQTLRWVMLLDAGKCLLVEVGMILPLFILPADRPAPTVLPGQITNQAMRSPFAPNEPDSYFNGGVYVVRRPELVLPCYVRPCLRLAIPIP